MGRYNFNQRTRDGYEISPEQAAKWLERNDNKPRQLSEKTQKWLIMSVAKRLTKMSKA